MKVANYKLIVITLFALSSWAQSAKLKVTPADYEKWGTLSGELISPDGKWVSCKMEYQSGNDTLFVINTTTLKRRDFPGAASATFSPDSKKMAIKFHDFRLEIHDLKNHEIKTYSGIKRFDFLSNGNEVMLQENQSKGQDLKLHDVNHTVLTQIQNVADYSIGNSGNIAVISESGVAVIHNKKGMLSNILSDRNAKYNRLNWSKSGNSVAFFSQSKTSADSLKIVHYNCTENKTNTLSNSNIKFEGKPYNIEPYKIVISENDKQVYFMITDIKDKPQEEKLVEVWESATRLEYPEQELSNDPEVNPYLTIWDVDSGQLKKVDDGDFMNTKILPRGKYALAQSKSSIVSQTAEIPPTDYYSINLEDGKSTLVVKQCSRSAGIIKASPSGQYVTYFKEGDYYVFDNEIGKSLNLTANINVAFKNVEFDNAGETPGYYSPGFTSDSRFVILYDQYDVWLFSPDGKMAKKITNGRETRTRFRVEIHKNDKQFDNVAELSRESIDIQKGIVLAARGSDMSSGYYRFNENEGLQKFNYAKSKSSRIVKAKSTDIFLYTEETEAEPPKLVIADKSRRTPKVIFQSNKHSFKYQWSHSELVTYQNSGGDTLKGILMYPVDYQVGKKYPMVVYIYERLSSTRYDYINPVATHHIGFSPPTYLLDGYFVLMPDIKYEIGNPGPSSVDCVTAAVNNIKQRNIIQENHIGLIGHSFGGFQTAYIISQTSIFAAAVAGGTVADPINAYLTMNFDRNRSNNWRFEDQQFRMASSPFNDWYGYIRNSTIAHAANIKTPLLSWSGKSDSSVDFRQSVALHLALRSLHKPNTLLLYPEQDHILSNPKAKLDLTMRVKAWFDYYLKNTLQ